MFKNSTFGLSGNLLKVFAAICMTIDHVGMLMYPQIDILRIIGRLAFPVFAYLICEGCHYTKNKIRYLVQIFLIGVATSIVYYFAMDEIYLNVLVSFSFSIILIYLIMYMAKVSSSIYKLSLFVLFAVTSYIIYLICELYTVDYGFWGVFLPVIPSLTYLLPFKKSSRLLILSPQFPLFALGLVVLCVTSSWHLQIYSLYSLIPLALYNGNRGFKLPKHFFYIFYPAHIGIIYLISMVF